MRFRVLSLLACALVFMASGAGVAAATLVATTEPATLVKHYSATLRGLADTGPTGSAWLFEYGSMPALGSYTQPKPIGSGRQQVELTLHHLKAGATYYFRLVVIQGGYLPSASFGTILRFKTKDF